MANCSYADELFAVSGRDYQMPQMESVWDSGGKWIYWQFQVFSRNWHINVILGLNGAEFILPPFFPNLFKWFKIISFTKTF